MRAAACCLFVVLALPIAAQMKMSALDLKPKRDLRELLIGQLDDAKVQIGIGVTGTQRSMMNIRLSEMAFNFGFDMARASLSEEGDDGMKTFNASFSTTPGRALFPFLAENQIAKLRRLAIKNAPLAACGTDEVAFALELTNAQRARIDALYVKQMRQALDPSRPSVKAMMNAFQELSKESAKLAENSDGSMSLVNINKTQPLVIKLFRAFEKANRLSAKEKYDKEPSILPLLTAPQRRRLHELSLVSHATHSRR